MTANLNDSLVSTLDVDENVLFTNCRIFRDGKILKDDLWVKGGKIIDGQLWFYANQEKATRVVDCKGHILAPGFIDIQLNGGFGVDFSIPEKDLDTAIKTVAEGVLAHGVTAFCPTIITSGSDTYSALVPQHTPREGGRHGAAVLGLHLEGPFINPAKNGCHPVEKVKTFDLGPPEQSPEDAEERLKTIVSKGATAADAIQSTVVGAVTSVYPEDHLDKVAIVTMAPEIPGAPDAIRYFVEHGIRVSVGHSRSDLKTSAAAVEAGASLVTHMFNAMSAFHHRDPGIVGLIADPVVTQSDRKLYYGVIVDGFHTHPTALRMAFATYAEGCVLVTDSMAGMGLPAGEHRLGSLRVHISEERKATLADKPETLAGSVATMAESVKNFADIVGVENALTSATLRPAEALGIDDHKGSLRAGCDADFVLLNDQLEVQATYIAGQVCWALDSHAAALFYSPIKGQGE